MLQFGDDYHVRVISTGDEMAQKSSWTESPLLFTFGQ